MGMIEKVARAICAHCGDNPDESDTENNCDMWELYLPLAKVAIEAMMEPTDAVHIAAVAEWDKETNGQGGAYQATRAIVNACLRQALKDT